MDQKRFRQTTEERLEHSGSFRTITYLCLFGLAITIPLLLLLGGLLLQSVSAQRAQLQGHVSQAVDALVSDLDRDLDRDITILRTLGTSQALARADWPTFYDEARASLQGRAYLVLVDAADSRQLVNTYVPYGNQPTLTGDPETVRRIIQTKESVVSNLFVSLVVKKPVFNVSIPILQNGHVRYVMSLGRLPDDLVRLLNSQNLGSQWVTLVWDAKGVILARSQNNARYIGRPLPENMREHDQRAVIRTTNLEGIDVLHATARSRLSGWGVGVNVPYSLIAQQMRNSLLLWGAVAILAITIALALGLFFARPITLSLSAAAKAAAAFGQGERFGLTGSRLKEADEFLITLGNAQRARQELTEELKRSRDWLHTTLTSIGDGVIATDAQGMITLMNSMAEDLTGWTLQEAEGKPLSDIFCIINQETRQAVENPVDKVRRLNSIVGLANHTVLVSKNGQEIAIDDSGAPVFSADGTLAGVVLVFRDVTEQRAAQKATSRLAAIVEFSGDAVLTKSLDGILQTWNTGAERLFGYKATEVIGQPVTILIPPDGLDEEAEILRRIRQGRPSERLETIRVAKDGRRVPVSVGVSPVNDAEGRIIGASNVIHDMTELVAAREALVREKELLATTLASIGDAVIATDAQGRITFLNAEAERLTGWQASDATGRPLPDVFRIINEKTQQIVENPIEKCLRLGTAVGLANHTLLLTKDGREIPIDDSAAPIRAPSGTLFGVVLVFRDFTERKEAETKLAEQAGLLELTSDAIIVRDDLGRISYWNKGAEDLYGWSQAEAVGKITHDLLRTKFPQPLQEIVDRVRKEKHWQGELVHTRKSGEQVTVLSRWVQVHSADRDSADARSLMEVNTDITRRKQLEVALQSNERLALAGRLSASIAHEINNPIDAVSNALYLINQRIGGQPDVEKLISLAQTEALRVAEITRNMLSLHRESRAVSAVKLSELLEGVVALIEETLAKGRNNIKIVPGFEGELEAFPSELRQVFTNVIKNAVEATADDGEIRIYSEVAQESGQDGVFVFVIDNGVGIPEEMKEKLFSPFVTTKEETGTGLGLWVSRSILEKHGGSIRLGSNMAPDHQGTKVSIFLPLKVSTGKIAPHEPITRSEAAS